MSGEHESAHGAATSSLHELVQRAWAIVSQGVPSGAEPLMSLLQKQAICSVFPDNPQADTHLTPSPGGLTFSLFPGTTEASPGLVPESGAGAR